MRRRRKRSGPTTAWGLVLDALVLLFVGGMVARAAAMTLELAGRAEISASPVAAHADTAGMIPSGDLWRLRYRLSNGFRMVDTIAAQLRPRIGSSAAKAQAGLK